MRLCKKHGRESGVSRIVFFMQKIIVSFSGGRTSAYMAYKMQFSPEFSGVEKHYVFANTGKELEETLIFADRCDREFGLNLTWVESVINPTKGIGVEWKQVNFESANRTGFPFDQMVKKFGIPNIDFPHCTRELKERPMSKWAKEVVGGKYFWAIGMRADERKREKFGTDKMYPLITTWPTNERMVRDFWSRMPFDLGLKDYEGNCDLCWKKSLAKRLTIISENPAVVEQWEKWEQSSEYVFDRDGFTIQQIKAMAQRPFKKTVDKHIMRKQFPELDLIDIFCESACTCG